MAIHRFTPEQIAFLKSNIKGRGYHDMCLLFNAHFGLDLQFTKIKSALQNHALKNGRDCRFQKGLTPHNKGHKGIAYGGRETQFKKGHRPRNWRPVGSERVVEGYVEIKIDEPKKWRSKHRHLWERAHGPCPKGHVIIFADGDRRNFALDNLVCVFRKELYYLNRHGRIYSDAELTKTGINVARLALKICDRRT
jgi:hypothetical protein